MALSGLSSSVVIIFLYLEFKQQAKNIKILESQILPKLDICEVENPEILLKYKSSEGRIIERIEEMGIKETENAINDIKNNLYVERIETVLTVLNPTERTIVVRDACPENIVDHLKKIYNDCRMIYPDVHFENLSPSLTNIRFSRRVYVKPNEPTKFNLIYKFSKYPKFKDIEKLKIVESKLEYGGEPSYTGTKEMKFSIILKVWGEEVDFTIEKFLDKLKEHLKNKKEWVEKGMEEIFKNMLKDIGDK